MSRDLPTGDPTPNTAGKTVAQQQIAGLLALAGMIERHPELADSLRFPLRTLHSPLISRDEDPRGTLEAFAAAAADSGAVVRVDNDRTRCEVTARFGVVEIAMTAGAELMAGREPLPKYAPLAVPDTASVAEVSSGGGR